VLSGVIAAHMAASRVFCLCTESCGAAHIAACLGVYLHGRAGEILEERFPRRGVLAREIADAIPLAYPARDGEV
jgi:NAD(P)H-hydrate epimerase